MPMYEFVCQECGTEFEELCTMSEVAEGKVVCPECEATKVEKKMSTFASATGAAGGGAGGGCGTGGFG